jgi:Na+/H+ antiporter NhaC
MSKNIVNQIEQTNHILKTGIFTLARVPISLGGIGLVTFLYWHNRIDQYPWMILCVLFLSPFYSEGMKMIGEFMQRRNGKS